MVNHVLIDGQQQTFKANLDWSFAELVEKVYEYYNTEEKKISSLKINGIEITESHENALKTSSVRNVETIVIKTAFLSEMVQETLSSVGDLLGTLVQISENLVAETSPSLFQQSFIFLLDGIQTVMSALTTVGKNIGPDSQELMISLESELKEILERLLIAHHKGDAEESQVEVVKVMKNELIPHFKKWTSQGIPKLRRLRDC